MAGENVLSRKKEIQNDFRVLTQEARHLFTEISSPRVRR
jgi:hypothetical protein